MLQWIVSFGVGAILGGIVTHYLTISAREAERQYERAFNGYADFLEKVRNILEGNIAEQGGKGVEQLLIQIDRMWLYASDEVIKLAYQVVGRSRLDAPENPEQDRLLMGHLAMEMRQDLRRRQSLWYKLCPWGRTGLRQDDYQLLGPGPRFGRT